MNMKFSDLKGNGEGRLLIVDDERFLRSMLVQAFSLLGYHVEAAAAGKEALVLLEMRLYDVMILDLGLPDLNGVEVMQQACRIQPKLMIIVLTGRASLESAVAAIKHDVIDYLFKPTGIQEIVGAVVRALQKREEQRKQFAQLVSEALDGLHKPDRLSSFSPLDSDLPPTRSMVIVPPLQLDRSNRLVTLTDESERTLTLTKGETAVLCSLMSYPNRPLSCQQLVRTAWGYSLNKFDAASVIRPYIFRLRHKIETNPKKPRLILTVRRQGYQFQPKNSY